jgi:hypothetical protein
MRHVGRCSLLMVAAALSAAQAHAQTQAPAQTQAAAQTQAPAQTKALTADELVEKHLTALGGRSALAKLESRVARGTISISAQGADVAGPVEIYAKAPNKTRTYFRVDLSQFGAGELVVDQRCDGKTAFVSNSMRGDREITGTQLQGMLNASFPTPLLTYKQAGTALDLKGKDKVGTRDVYVLQYMPKAGPSSTQFFDAETWLLVRVVTKVDAAELGGEMEQTTDLSDYRDVDGVKVAFALKVVNPVQTLAVAVDTIEHNKPLDDAMFARPAAK